MTLRRLAIALVFSLAAGTSLACSDDEALGPGDTPEPEPPETIDIEMTIDDFSFDPVVIEAELGAEVFIELANDGDEEHTFTLNEFFVDEALESGEDVDVSFVANDPGEFNYYCRNHPEQMQGALRVSRPADTD